MKKTNILATGAIIALLPVMSYALQGTYVTEPFSCKVALADYAELQRVLEITPRTDFKYQIFLDEYSTVVKALELHTECKGD